MGVTEERKAIVCDKKRCASTLNLAKIRDAIPAEAFEKSIVRAFCYLLFDYSMWLGSLCVLVYLNKSGITASLPHWQQYALTAIYWLVSGFFMWCIFVVGHDCGHGTFSDNWILNDIVGHLCHGSIIVPYYPWQLSHRKHHMYHNHVDKDYSHPWYTPDKLEKPEEWMAKLTDQHPWFRFFFPFIGWPVYLYGLPDGSHWIPFPTQRLWTECDAVEYKKCVLSTAVVVVFVMAFYHMAGQDLMSVLYYYAPSYLVFSWWLVTVTYLQHHNHDTLVYDDDDWNFVGAAFETVDRTFGFGIDFLHHHITDGHVAHHLFFTKIPHYNLKIATNAIIKYLKDHKLEFLYKSEITYDFPYRVHKYMVLFGLGAARSKPLSLKIE